MTASTLGFALLGLLARRPRTGYELAAALRAPIGYFWSAGHSQIYPELGRLEDGGLVRHRVIAGPGPRDNKRYAVTAAGRRALADWAGTSTGPSPQPRDEFLLKVYSLWLVDQDRARALVRVRREEHAAQLAAYETLRAATEQESGTALHDPSTPEFASYATLRCGLSYERHAVSWCDWLIGELTAAGRSGEDAG